MANDSTFGTDGRADYQNEPAYGYAIAVDSKDRLVTGGKLPNGPDEALINRFTASGDQDTAFGNGDGVVYNSDLPMTMGSIKAVAVDDSDRVYLVGEHTTPTNLHVFRLDVNGIKDNSFNGDGVASLDTSGAANIEYGYAVAVAADGSVVVAGESDTSYVLAKFTEAGAVDTSFDADGFVLDTVPGTDYAAGNAVVVQPDGKIIVAGTGRATDLARGFVARYLADGSLDDDFASGGRLFLYGETTEGPEMEIVSMIQQADGRIVVAGTYRSGSADPSGLVVARIWD